MNLFKAFDPLLWDIFIERLESDSKSIFKNQTRLEIITYLKDNLNQFSIDENDIIYLTTNGTIQTVFSDNHKNEEAIQAFKLLIQNNYDDIEDE